MRNLILAILVSAAALGAPSARAQSPEVVEGCRDHLNPDRVAACTRLIDGGNLDDGQLAQALNWRLAARIDAKDYVGAIVDADRYAILQPDTVLSHVMRCMTRAFAGRELEVADRACEAALALSKDPALYTARGFLRLKQGRNAEAWFDFDQALREGAADQPLYGLGIASLRLGRTPEGQADLVAALQIEPGVAQTFADWGIRPPAP